MTVADLDKGEVRGRSLRASSRAQHSRNSDTAGHGINHTGSRPSHTFQKSATIDSVVVVVRFDIIRHKNFYLVRTAYKLQPPKSSTAAAPNICPRCGAPAARCTSLLVMTICLNA